MGAREPTACRLKRARASSGLVGFGTPAANAKRFLFAVAHGQRRFLPAKWCAARDVGDYTRFCGRFNRPRLKLNIARLRFRWDGARQACPDYGPKSEHFEVRARSHGVMCRHLVVVSTQRRLYCALKRTRSKERLILSWGRT